MKARFSSYGMIRKFCLECCGHSTKEVKYCPVADCQLWPCRFGCSGEVAARRMGDDALVNSDNFMPGAKFGPDKSVSGMES